MGISRSLGYNFGIGARNRRVREAQNDEFEAVPASKVAAGDRLLVPEFPTEEFALSITVRSIENSDKRLPGLGIVRFGAANSKILRISAELDDGSIESMELPGCQWVLRRRIGDADTVDPPPLPATPPSARTPRPSPPPPSEGTFEPAPRGLRRPSWLRCYPAALSRSPIRF